MENEKYGRIVQVVEKQEEMLRVGRFLNSDAWDLGQCMVRKIQEKQIALAVAIRRLNGYVIFQYASEKTALSNQNWMLRKFNTVAFTHCSSLKAWAEAEISGYPMQTHGLNEKEYVFFGGGFPIRLRSGELVAVATSSNLTHEQDHQFLVDALSEWLSVENVPSVE